MRNLISAWHKHTHPGEIIREDILPELKISKAAFARALGVSRPTLYDIMNEKRSVTIDFALRLGKVCGNGPELWLNLQRVIDLEKAEKSMADELNTIQTLYP